MIPIDLATLFLIYSIWAFPVSFSSRKKPRNFIVLHFDQKHSQQLPLKSYHITALDLSTL